MQARTAPPLTGQYTERTTEISALKFLLLGEDDSALEEVIAPNRASNDRSSERRGC